MRPERALVILGSPRGGKGSSAAVGAYLGERLRAKGLQVESVEAYRSLSDQEGRDRLLKGFDGADLVLICFPLYVDTLPAGLLAALQLVCESAANMTAKERILAAECQCGFPEASQNQTALRSCEHFARRMGMRYAGGMAMGEGGMLGQMPLAEFKYAKHHLPLFDRAADRLAEGEAIPKEVIEGLMRPFVTPWLYVLFANRGWNAMAKGNGVRGRIKEEPYSQA